MEESKQGGEMPFDLSELSGFQFGPSWAKPGAETTPSLPKMHPIDRGERGERGERGSRHSKGPFPSERRPRGRRGEGRDDAFSSAGADGRRPRSHGAPYRDRREDRPVRELPQPAEGFRVELRPCNSILEIFSKEIQKQKRAMALLDLSRIVMAAKERYDLVFMKLEDAPLLIHSTRPDGACWLTEAEAVSYLWSAPWFHEYYAEQEVETEAPKGSFTAIASCQLGGEVIGPVNWHGYQAALMNLYRSKYASMRLDAFKNRIVLNKDEEAVQAWIASASKKTVWKPVREGAEEVLLEDARSVEADFLANHYSQAYELVDKVFINGSTPRKRLSPGLAAHLAILSDKTRRSPQMLIPNLCHGLARHHMPIYKWQGNHYTGPSRIRAIPADTVLADRMMAMVNWSKENSGKKVDEMFAALSGVPIGTDEESRKAAADAYAPYVADMIWLLEQGFLVVTGDNSIWFPKGGLAPKPTKLDSPSSRKRRGREGHGKGDQLPAAKKKEKNSRPSKDQAAGATPDQDTPSASVAEEAPAPEEAPVPEA